MLALQNHSSFKSLLTQDTLDAKTMHYMVPHGEVTFPRFTTSPPLPGANRLLFIPPVESGEAVAQEGY